MALCCRRSHCYFCQLEALGCLVQQRPLLSGRGRGFCSRRCCTLPLSCIGDEELTHGPFMHTPPQQRRGSSAGLAVRVQCHRWDGGRTAGACLGAKDLLRHPRLNRFTLVSCFEKDPVAPVSSVTPRLSLDRRGRNTPAAKPVFICRRKGGQRCTRPEPGPTPTAEKLTTSPA